MSQEAFVRNVFASIDAMDSAEFVTHITPNGKFTFGNYPTAEGREAIKGSVDYVFTTFKGLSHTITGLWEQGDDIIVRLSIDYTRHDDNKVTLPCVNIFKIKDGLIDDYRIYMDIGPVYA